MTQHDFSVGQSVTILNQTMGGRFVVEGKATITSLLTRDNCYMVDFGDGGGSYERFVDPSAQETPQACVRKLNDGTAS